MLVDKWYFITTWVEVLMPSTYPNDKLSAFGADGGLILPTESSREKEGLDLEQENRFWLSISTLKTLSSSYLNLQSSSLKGKRYRLPDLWKESLDTINASATPRCPYCGLGDQSQATAWDHFPQCSQLLLGHERNKDDWIWAHCPPPHFTHTENPPRKPAADGRGTVTENRRTEVLSILWITCHLIMTKLPIFLVLELLSIKWDKHAVSSWRQCWTEVSAPLKLCESKGNVHGDSDMSPSKLIYLRNVRLSKFNRMQILYSNF